ncbi:hypothetical protein B0H16DRAFT_1742690 [Mycena metata]|uniref:CCHC-type domain-containing protein n=1 Tax=Mycena metata TaxID=1033252 RepID=A0AAD7MFP5_9AGAR|nr:hypothetical protein B0H16DRAFT_1742690 [Mycena metata]
MALHRFFYNELLHRIKELLTHTDYDNTLNGLKLATRRIDARYWQHQGELEHECAQQKATSGGTYSKTSGNSGASPVSPSNNAGGKGKGKGNKLQKPRPSGSTPPAASGNAGQASTSMPAKPKAYVDKLDKSGKLKPEERKRYIKFKLCLFCGGSGHKTNECKKRPGNQALGKAGSVSTPPAPSADTSSSSESKK